MGTSGLSSGPNSNTPLVPTWLDEPDAEAVPGVDVVPSGDTGNQGDQTDDIDAPGDQDNQNDTSPRPAIEPAPQPARFRVARRNFSSFARSGGNDRGALRRAVRDYVRSGTGGSRRATRRVGASRVAAGGMFNILRGFQRDGIDTTLRQHNLENLVGRPVVDVFLGLTDVICPDGGSIDEGIARDAWLETIADLDQLGIENLDGLSTEQLQEVFLTFAAHAIETRLFQDIGTNGFRMAADLSAVEAFEAQLHDYIRRAMRDAFSSDLTDLPSLSDQYISSIVDETYQNAWDILSAWGDIEE
ncbi:MAG: hypothetical protein OXI72_13195 [Gemmatimonadota bacterium]|nr:hypothetical protein [Gemmatimonadota bacterium]